MTTNINIHPYYDDFDPAKNFHQILFNPGLAVQGRELTQIQSILRNQIAKFGDHVFKHGSVVIPGNSHADLYASYVKVSGVNGNTIDNRLFKGQVIVGETSGVRALVTFTADREGTDPDVFYVKYISGSTTGNITFDIGETLHLELDVDKKVVISSDIDAIGFGTIAHVNEGVYYVNGTFVQVNKQSVLVDKFSSNPSARVMLRIDETIIDATEDESLLDPAQGSNNFAAPGADRLKIDLILVSRDVDIEDSADYIELMRFRDGVLEEHSRYPKYSELEKSLARRTFDESGNYVVNGLALTVKENKKVGNNNGDSPSGDSNKLTYLVSPGKAYYNGFEIETLSPKKVVVDKARTADHVIQSSASIKPSFGQYFLVSNPTGRLNTDTRETVQLWNDSDSSGGTKIGSAKVLAIDYYIGDGSVPIYKIFVSDVVLTQGSFEEIGSIRTTTPFHARVVAEADAYLNSGTIAPGEVINFNTNVRTATVALYVASQGKLFYHKHDNTKLAPKIGDQVVGASGNATLLIQSKKIIHNNGQPGVVFQLPSSATKSLKDSNNSFDLTFVAHRKLVIPEGSTNATISGGTFVAIETGTFVAISNSGVENISNYSIDSTGTVLTRSSPAPVGGVTLYVQTNNIGIPRTKSIQTSTPISKTSAAVITLDHADVFEIISVISGGVDIKNSYTLDRGISDYEYGLSKLRLNTGLSLPAGSVTITYRYFSHTAGDFFTVDSYSSLPIDEIPSYRAPNGEVWSLRDCIDFRKTVGVASNVVVSDTILKTSVQRYVSRIDSVCIDRQKNIVVISGTPSETPKKALIPQDTYELESVLIPAYTFSIEDIRTRREAATRYTMENISEIEERIDRLEEFSTLTAQEGELLKTEIIDAATGLDRFKTGYVVEDMTDPFGLAAAYDPSFRCTMNSEQGILPRLEATMIQLNLSASSSGLKNTGGVLTLPYTEKPFASQIVSSRTTNLNPFMLIKWEGMMYLTPANDIWTEILDLPDILIYKEVEQVVTREVWVSSPPPPTPPAPPSPPVVSSGGGHVVGPSSGQAVFGPASPPANDTIWGTNISARDFARGLGL